MAPVGKRRTSFADRQAANEIDLAGEAAQLLPAPHPREREVAALVRPAAVSTSTRFSFATPDGFHVENPMPAQQTRGGRRPDSAATRRTSDGGEFRIGENHVGNDGPSRAWPF